MNQPTPQDLHEARLTAYALDELAGDERLLVERLLADGTPAAAAAAQEIARIREVGTQLTRELARELGDVHAPTLTAAQRAVISRAATPARPRPILRWSLAAGCAALAAALMVAVLLPGGAPDAQTAGNALSRLSKDMVEKADRGLARATHPDGTEPKAPNETVKQEEQLGAPVVARSERHGNADAVATNRPAAVARDEPARKQDHVLDARAQQPSAAPAPAAAFGGVRAPSASAGEQSAAAPAAPVVAAAPAPPAAPAAASAPRYAAPPADARQLLAAKTRAVALQEEAAPGAPAAEAMLILIEREKYVRNSALDAKEAKMGADKAAAAGAAAPSPTTGSTANGAASSGVAPTAEAAQAGTGAEDMVPTSQAATVQVPLHARTQSLDSVRRCLDAGRLPPPALVQIGDLINAVPPGHVQPGVAPATIAIVPGPCPWQPDHQLLGIVIAARTAAFSPRQPLNLVLLVDGSAAMGGDDRLPLIKSGLASLVRGLGGADRLSLVAFGTQAQLIIDGAGAEDSTASLAAIARLAAAASPGGADAAAGLTLAAKALHLSHRAGSSDEVVLCTAGVPDGDQALADQLRGLAADGVGLELMAVGHDHAEDGALERLAALGRGSFTYLATAAQAAAALGGISGPREVVARQALAGITFSPAEIASYRLVGAQPMTPRRPAAAADRGELRTGQTVTLLFEVARPPQLAERRLRSADKAGTADPALVSVQLSYLLPDGQPGPPITVRLGVAEAIAGPDRIDPAVVAAAELGLALRHPADRRYQWGRMLANARAERSLGKRDTEGDDQLLDLITRAAALAATGSGR